MYRRAQNEKKTTNYCIRFGHSLWSAISCHCKRLNVQLKMCIYNLKLFTLSAFSTIFIFKNSGLQIINLQIHSSFIIYNFKKPSTLAFLSKAKLVLSTSTSLISLVMWIINNFKVIAFRTAITFIQ